LRDPYEVLGLDQDTARDVVERTARRLQRELHPDRFPDADAATIAATTRRFAEVNEAVHILTDAKALQRYRARQARERRGSATPNEPGRDGVRFTAAPPTAGSAVAPSPGDPDFDYRERARSEFDLRRLPDPSAAAVDRASTEAAPRVATGRVARPGVSGRGVESPRTCRRPRREHGPEDGTPARDGPRSGPVNAVLDRCLPTDLDPTSAAREPLN
jgi:curved DNA-binding protein CbpA